MQAVEPAACLVHAFTDVIGLLQIIVEKFLVFKRIMQLRKRHGAGIKPAVDHFRGAFHLTAAFSTRKGSVVNKRPVQIILTVFQLVCCHRIHFCIRLTF